MQELTEFDWFGARIRVATDDASLGGLIHGLWGAAPRGETGAAAARAYEIRLRPPGVFSGPSGSRPVDPRQPAWHAYNLLLDDLLSTVGGHFVLHAAALAKGGRGLVLQGPSTFGKTTLSLHLAQRGFALLSDDVTVLDRGSGRLLPIPRAISLRPGARETLGPDLLARARTALRAVHGDEWLVDPRAWLGPPPEDAGIALVVILRADGDGEGIRRFPAYEVRVVSGEEGLLGELARLEGVRRVEGLAPWAARAEVDDSRGLTAWLERNRARIVSVQKLMSEPPDFSGEPLLRPVGPFQAALELGQEMLNRQAGSRLAREFRGRETEMIAELGAALRGARCFALRAGRLEGTIDLLASAFDEATGRTP